MGPEGSNLKISDQGQEFFALDHSRYKTQGYFVDLGAADGITANNTFILEKFYKWSGICVDPNPKFEQSLTNCRDVFTSNLCVYNKTGDILPFKFCIDDSQFFGWNFRAGLVNHVDVLDKDVDSSFVNINVLSITLNDLLELYHAPSNIDYISMDTEGSEFEILNAFDFNKYNVKCWTIEHSFDKQRDQIFNLMTKNGYSLYKELDTNNEDWYFKS